MRGETLFISDLHLDASRPGVTSLFLEFLSKDACESDALYILGDLFEAWIGDDDLGEHNRSVLEGIKKLVDSGIPVYGMHGNRDFLMGEQFCQMSGMTFLKDPTVIELYGTRTLLMHGDMLCSDDVQYLEFRKTVRAAQWQQEFLAKPLEERDSIVRSLREESQKQTKQKPQEIMDVTQSTVEEYMRNHACLQLIHGHTHRPAIHEFNLDGKPARRIVLGDWYEQGSVLRCKPQECTLHKLQIH